MLPILTLAAIAVLLMPVTAQADYQTPDTDPFASITGQWATQGYGGVVELSKCQDETTQLCGRLDWVWDAGDVPADALGTIILRHGTFNGERWEKVRILDPESGETFRGTVTQLSIDQIELKGCAFVFCRTQIWRRLNSLPHVTASTHQCEP